jgi:hypothetical protein
VGVGDIAGEAVELGNGKDRAGPDCGECLVEAGPVGASGAREASVDVDPVGGDAERDQFSIWISRSCSSVEQRA